ncbi:MAG: hypothetical protein KF889_27795 [Alphaproteobacteria bacterium]|nr:hypothetical protein [Alphaproteobacteria bacterium]MCW5743759.1 hypothetical protein [Alphaproteobacteria bacterium]
MKGRGRFWISHLTLMLVIVGAASHGFASQSAQCMRLLGLGFAEGTALSARGTLPTLRGTRQITDARKSTPPGGKTGDVDAPPPVIAATRQSGTQASAVGPDLGRRPSTSARQTHRPRDPPFRL